MSQRTWNRSLLVASLIAVAVSAASVWIEWSTSRQFTLRLSLLALALVFSAACASYSLRVIRLYVLLAQGGVPISFRSAALAQGVGFALSVTPGSVGDLFRLHLVQERAGKPLLQTAPVLLLDRVMEGAGFICLALLSAAALPALRIHVPDIALGAAGLVAAGVLVLAWIQSGRIMAIGRAVLYRFRIGLRLVPSLRQVWQGVRASLTPRELAAGLTLTALARVTDGLVLLLAAQMLGVSVALPVAIFVIAAGGFAGGISLLPGGAGATETTMAGLLVLAGAPLASALAITLLARMSTLWLWVGLGLGMAFILQFRPRRGTIPEQARVLAQ